MTPLQTRKYKLGPALAECAQHEARLCSAWREAERFPQWAAAVPQPFSDDEVKTLDQLLFRFGRLQDALASRALPALLQALEEWDDAEPFLDKLDRAERLGVIPSADQWLMLRELRNMASHEYPDQPQIVWDNLRRFLLQTPELLNIHKVLTRIFHKLHTPSLVFCSICEFRSVGRMNNYAAPSRNSPMKQNPARSSREFMKYPG